MRMTRRAFVGSVMSGVAAMGITACGSGNNGNGSNGGGEKALTGTYAINEGGYDFGMAVDRATLTFDAPVDAVSATDFVVQETKQVTDWEDPTFPILEATLDRTITDAYLADESGARTDAASNTVVLELNASPSEGANCVYNMAVSFNMWCDPYYLTFALADGAALTSEGTAVTSISVAQDYTAKTSAADVFDQDSFTASDGITLKYTAFTPEVESKALLVWLHGMGEGGEEVTHQTDVTMPIMGGKVTALAGKELQDKVAIHVLAPQCPTVWSDIDGKMTNFQDGIDLKDDCYYREALAELIDSYAEGIGVEKIIIAGCSAGGFMTMNMAVHYLDKYTAYIPICEAYRDEYISDEELAELAKLPLFFIASANDDTVLPEGNWGTTTQRLIDANASELHSFVSEKVIDTSGAWTNEDGSPYEYGGHFSWVYFHNNEADCDICGIPVFDWIAEQAG